MSYFLRHTVIRLNRPIIYSAFFFFFAGLYSCAGIAPEVQVEEDIPLATESVPPEKKEDIRQEVYSNFIQASLNMARGKYVEAREHLSIAVQHDPDSIYLNKKMAILLQKLEDTQGAIEYARKSVKLDPNDIGSHMLLAELYSIKKEKELEIEEYHTILDLDPKNQRVRMILATVLIRKGLYNDAMKHLDDLIKQNPDMTIAYYYRGRIHLELNDYQLAEREYLKAVELNESMEPALFDLASLYQMQNRLEEAADIYRKLLHFYPSNIVAKERLIGIYSKLGEDENLDSLIEEIKKETEPGDPGRQTLGLFYLQRGKLAESISELDLIVTAWPEDQKSRYYLALAYEENGQPEKALEHFRLMKQGSEYFSNSQIHIAYILEEMEKYDEAIDVLTKAIEKEKNKPDLYLMLASILETIKEYDRAMEVVKEGLTYHEGNIELIFRLGVILDKLGDKENSIKQMRKILEIDPDHADSLNYIGYTYAEKGINLDEAMDLIQKALKVKPNSGYIIDSLGWVYYQKGLYDKALDSLQKAFSLISDDPTIAEHLGDVYFKLKQYQKSLDMYQKALTLEHQFAKKILEKIEKVKELME